MDVSSPVYLASSSSKPVTTTPPPVRSSMGTGIPCCPKYDKGAPMGGMARKVCGPIFPGVYPSDPIHWGCEDSVESPSKQEPDWRQA